VGIEWGVVDVTRRDMQTFYLILDVEMYVGDDCATGKDW
jgi:hypothetical protein